jgi:GAF domain-containing protein
MKSKKDAKGIRVPEEIINNWQNIVNIMADLINIPTALITKADPAFRIVVHSSKPGNSDYKAGYGKELLGILCEEVLMKKGKLKINNSSEDKRWKEIPDERLGIISYLGFPIIWPDGEVFGTICVLDTKKHRYGEKEEKLILQFKELVEGQLEMISR